MIKAVSRIVHSSGRAESYAIFLFWPFYSLASSLLNYKSTWSKNSLWLFIIFYGYTFVISDVQLDSDRYSQNLITLSQQHSLSLNSFVELIYDKDSKYVDILQPLLTYLISRVTDNPRILFAIFGLIFGFFYSRNLWFLISHVKEKIKPEALPFIILFAFVVAIWQINGFRFWTAAHVFIYGFFLIIKDERNKGVLICASSVFIHFSFLLPVSILIIYLVLGNRMVLFFLFYAVSFFGSQVSTNTFKTYSDKLPIVFQERSEKYTSEAYVRGLAKSFKKKPGNWYVAGRFVALNYTANLLLFFVFWYYRREIRIDKILLSLFCFSILLASVVNFLSAVPSMARFSHIFYLLLFAFFFIFTQRSEIKVFPQWIKAPFLLATLLFVIVEVRIGFDTMGIMTIVGNPFVAPFVENNSPLIDLIK